MGVQISIQTCIVISAFLIISPSKVSCVNEKDSYKIKFDVEVNCIKSDKQEYTQVCLLSLWLQAGCSQQGFMNLTSEAIQSYANWPLE